MIGGISGVGSFGMGTVASFYQSRLAEGTRNAQSAQQAQRQQQIPNLTVHKKASPETPVQAVAPIRPVSRDEVSVPELAQRLENDAAAMAGRMRTQYGMVNDEGIFVETGKEGLSPVQDSQKNTLEGRAAQAENALGRNDLKGAEDALANGAPKTNGLTGPEEEAIPGLPNQKNDEEAIPGVEASGAESAQEALEEGECETCEKRKYQDGSDDMGVSYQTPTNIKPEQAASAVRGHEMEHVYREQAKAEREGRKVVSQTVTMHTEICPECGKAYVSGGTTETVTKADTDANAQRQDAAQEDQKKSPAVVA